MEQYIERIKELENPSFQKIRKIASDSISHLTDQEQNLLWNQLERGVKELTTHEELCMYLRAFGNMHEARLHQAYNTIPTSLFKTQFEVVDWGCGQALGTIMLFDFLKEQRLENNIKRVTLIEPASFTLQRAELHTSIFIDKTVELNVINSYFEKIEKNQIKSKFDRPVLHIFSNILDVEGIDLKKLACIVDSTIQSDNYLICAGPMNQGNNRLDAFVTYFDEDKRTAFSRFESSSYKEKNMSTSKTCKIVSFKLEPIYETHLIPIKYYPSVQFQAAYELDLTRQMRKANKLQLNEAFTHFDVAAPFDLGASVYDDIHPVFAVLNNIVTRGLPTRASINLEELILKSYGCSNRTAELGETQYKSCIPELELQLVETTTQFLNDNISLDAANSRNLSLLFTPIAVARFHKMLIEAILTEKLSIEKESWEILVEEMDVPFAAIAIEDFKEMFVNLTQLSSDYENLKFPEIQLTVIPNPVYSNSPLHLGVKTAKNDDKKIVQKTYDMVVTLALFTKSDASIEAFSKYKCNNYCYFNVRSVTKRRTERTIYTTNLIRYKELVVKDNKGIYQNIEKTIKHIEYFLKLIFRKEEFRPGQTPILDRALRKLPVIGLLPTGGGKSLTYQLAALLQPGVTIIIDPLKSLMKDQYDGLRNNGIDNCAFINSSQTSEEKKKTEVLLESSRLLFVFLSPERLAIANFRDRLYNMFEHNVYFSYGVIDEVHCVSEWGHDFRFSYLHLGRNLYNYVRAKDGEISLFGLTATASFDVLADVERELSGDGAFPLSPDAIVKFENTDRIELQFKIEKVNVDFNNKFWQGNYNTLKELPNAKDAKDKWTAYKNKSSHLIQFFQRIPELSNELSKEHVKEQIIESYNTKSDDKIFKLKTEEIPLNCFNKSDYYPHAGIIFCPHVDNTSISVNINAELIKNNGVEDVGKFSGRDNDEDAIKNLELFRDNLKPIMVATKAFGMGIDKPNVRFTIHMNYPGSLEAFVQEAGRAGRDRTMALATILFSDYDLKRLVHNENNVNFVIKKMNNLWFKKEDFNYIIESEKIVNDDNDIQQISPSNDIVRLFCAFNDNWFEKNLCNTKCGIFEDCVLKDCHESLRDWMPEKALIAKINELNLRISKKHFRYINPDYEANMHFYTQSFQGDIAEKNNFYNIFLKNEYQISLTNGDRLTTSISKKFQALNFGETIKIIIPYLDKEEQEENFKRILHAELTAKGVNGNEIEIEIKEELKKKNNIEFMTSELPTLYYEEISKVIYRMRSIGLITDFTQNYYSNEFYISIQKRRNGEYYEGLKRYLLKYYSQDRITAIMNEVKSTSIMCQTDDAFELEIYKCIEFLNTFVYTKISEKRKRGLDDMRDFCIKGLSEPDWLKANIILKDELYYYFNSKYARIGYMTDNNESFSLTEDTDAGKISNSDILFKYMRVIDDDVIGAGGVPIDNIKHLYGAIRYIRRSLAEDNPTLGLLETFCLAYLGRYEFDSEKEFLLELYKYNMILFLDRMDIQSEFLILFESFNSKLISFVNKSVFKEPLNDIIFIYHTRSFDKLTKTYIQ